MRELRWVTVTDIEGLAGAYERLPNVDFVMSVGPPTDAPKIVDDVGYLQVGLQTSYESLVFGDECVACARTCMQEMRVDAEALTVDEIIAVSGGDITSRASTPGAATGTSRFPCSSTVSRATAGPPKVHASSTTACAPRSPRRAPKGRPIATALRPGGSLLSF